MSVTANFKEWRQRRKEDREWRERQRTQILCGLLTEAGGQTIEIEWQGSIASYGKTFTFFALDGEHTFSNIKHQDTLLQFPFGPIIERQWFSVDGREYTLETIRPDLSDIELCQLKTRLEPEKKDEFLAEYYDRASTRRSADRYEAMGFRNVANSLRSNL